MKHILYPILFLFFIFGISCTADEGCRKDKYVKMGVGFYTRTINATTNKVTITNLIVDSLTVQGIDTAGVLKDSIYNNSLKISKIYLPLNKFVTVSTFKVKFKQTVDTITIAHTNSNMYLSLECGCLKVHSIDTVLTTKHFIDSVSIKIHNVNNINAEHLQIYNKPSS
ncbi:MAG: DUF6452 family protein [Paludibacter sp.]